jgi:hypothetical protein
MLILAGVLAGAATSVQAHHSWGAVYDGGQPVSELSATIAGAHTTRPHNTIAVTIASVRGEPEEWRLQWRGGNSRDRNGNTVRYDFRIGDQVVIDGRRARDESQKLIQITSLVRPADGWTITAREGRGDER